MCSVETELFPPSLGSPSGAALYCVPVGFPVRADICAALGVLASACDELKHTFFRYHFVDSEIIPNFALQTRGLSFPLIKEILRRRKSRF